MALTWTRVALTWTRVALTRFLRVALTWTRVALTQFLRVDLTWTCAGTVASVFSVMMDPAVVSALREAKALLDEGVLTQVMLIPMHMAHVNTCDVYEVFGTLYSRPLWCDGLPGLFRRHEQALTRKNLAGAGGVYSTEGHHLGCRPARRREFAKQIGEL